MKNSLLLLAVLLSLSLSGYAQSAKPNDSIAEQIKSLGMERLITLSFDQPGNTTTIRAIGDYFANREASAAGVQAINFGIGLYFAGAALALPPETFQLTFWVHTSKARFAENRNLKIDFAGRTVNLGPGRYASRPNQQKEYLNFDIPRTALELLSENTSAVFRLGEHSFTLSKSQLALMRALAKICGPTVE